MTRPSGRQLAILGPPAGVREPADVVQDHADVGVRRAERGDEHAVRSFVQVAASSNAPAYLRTTARSFRTRAAVTSSAGRRRSAIASARR